jgi:hypothetical protein
MRADAHGFDGELHLPSKGNGAHAKDETHVFPAEHASYSHRHRLKSIAVSRSTVVKFCLTYRIVPTQDGRPLRR